MKKDQQLTPSTSEIWNEFSNRLKGFILKRVNNEYDAEDILQDVFCKIHDNIRKLEAQDKLQSWVYQITRNTVIDYYRRREVMVELSDIPENLVDEPNTDVNNAIVSCLEPMINNLPQKYREAIIMTHIDGLTQKEMAEKIGLSLSGAKSRVQRAREKLKEMLLECCHLEFDRQGNILEYEHKRHNCQYC